jgi:hypothetical protein
MSKPLVDMLSDDQTRGLAGAALASVEVELTRGIARLEKLQTAVWQRGHEVAVLRRAERTEATEKKPQQLHSARSLFATMQIVRALMWMQQKVIECRRQVTAINERLRNAWELVVDEGLRTHLLDVLEARIRGIDRVAMQNLIDCEQAWMLGKTAVPNRTGGGFHRADKELKHETVWLHNLMIRHASNHASLPVRHQGPSVAPPSGPLALGLRYDKGPRGTFESPLWPDSQAAKDALGLERLKRVESEASLARQRARASRPATAGVKPKKSTKKPHTWC